MADRLWGFWTEGKLDLLGAYLDAFTTATRGKSRARVYVDLFAGQPQNLNRLTENEILGSARRAIETDDPPFTRIDLCELPPRAAQLDAELRSRYPHAPFKVHPGDCNVTIGAVLAEIRAANLDWAPTFAFVDPDGPDFHWTTLEALAAHKPSRSRFKTEMWILFSAGLNVRMLPTDGVVTSSNSHQLTKMYGTAQWRAIYDARLAGTITPAQALEEYVNLMRWRLERDLGYRHTMALDVHNERDRSLYHMIFATDNDAGLNIMTSLYSQALVKFPEMRLDALRTRYRLQQEAAGQFDLFSMIDASEVEEQVANPTPSTINVERVQYVHEPPWAPLGSEDADIDDDINDHEQDVNDDLPF